MHTSFKHFEDHGESTIFVQSCDTIIEREIPYFKLFSYKKIVLNFDVHYDNNKCYIVLLFIKERVESNCMKISDSIYYKRHAHTDERSLKRFVASCLTTR